MPIAEIGGFEFHAHQYAQNKRLAIRATINGEPYCAVTSNVPEAMLDDNEVIINHACPLEIVDLLQDAGLLGKTVGFVQSGFVRMGVMVWNGTLR